MPRDTPAGASQDRSRAPLGLARQLTNPVLAELECRWPRWLATPRTGHPSL